MPGTGASFSRNRSGTFSQFLASYGAPFRRVSFSFSLIMNPFGFCLLNCQGMKLTQNGSSRPCRLHVVAAAQVF